MIRLQTVSLCGALMAALVVTSAAEAQRQIQVQPQGTRQIGIGGFGRGGLDQMSLIGMDQVQKELKVEEGQKEKVDALVTAHREKSRSTLALGNFRELSEEERRKAFAEIGEKREKLNKESETSLAEILKEEQSQRLGQILLQQQGVQALASKDVQQKLKLDEKQTKDIATAFDSHNEARGKLFEAARESKSFAELRDKGAELTKKRDETVLAVLSKEQSEAFTALKGKPFTLERPTRGARPTRRPANADNADRPKRPTTEE